MLKNHPAASRSFQMTAQERALLTNLVDYSSVQSLPEIWPIAAQRFKNVVALKDPHTKPEVVLTYGELYQQIQQFAAGLQALLGSVGVDIGSESTDIPPRVALIADNCPRWMIADQGIMTAGAANVVRGAQADRDELLYILAHSGSIALVVEDAKT
ncbi:MAG TPA: long-chain fatty acid--CoA ligase, partial [Cyanobacteria bacterium UBA11162]|nr:long-chain fatty acid--CoA ligase [Cyanobacteria bacterium UBA11162]